jgi:hypothetical protein
MNLLVSGLVQCGCFSLLWFWKRIDGETFGWFGFYVTACAGNCGLLCNGFE